MEQTQPIYNALDSLGEAFNAFKQTHEERLAQLEKKQACDPLTDIKLDRLQERLSQLEISTKRPGMTLEIDNHSPDFVAYARKGIEGYQTKALTSETEAHGGFLIPHPAFDKIQNPSYGLEIKYPKETEGLEGLSW